MSEAQVIAIVRRHTEAQFPKTCSRCGLVFPTLAAYVRTVRRVGEPVSYDVVLGDWQPIKPAGMMSNSNCSCGTTLSITTRGMAQRELLQLMRWARIETRRRGIDMRALLAYLRAKIDAEVLAEPLGQAAAD